MRTQYGKIMTRFEAETRFEAGPIAPAPFRGPLEMELEQLKERLLQPMLKGSAGPAQCVPLRRAANEAAGLAWITPFPLLVFPVLLEEKVAAAQRREAHQRQVREKTEGLLERAAA